MDSIERSDIAKTSPLMWHFAKKIFKIIQKDYFKKTSRLDSLSLFFEIRSVNPIFLQKPILNLSKYYL